MTTSFLQSIESQVISQPLAPAINAAGTIYSYQQLWDEITRMRQYLRSQNIRCLAIALPNSPAWIVLDLAAAIEQIVVVPVPHFFSATQVQHLVIDSGVDHLISNDEFGQRFTTRLGLEQGDTLNTFGTNIVVSALRSKHPDLTDTNSTLTDKQVPGYFKISYTSGTSGEPKGVLISRALVDKTVDSLLTRVGEASAKRHLSVLPYSLLLENIVGIYAVLASGGCCYVSDFDALGISGSSKIDWPKFAAVVQATQPSSMIMVPALLQGLMHCIKHLALEINSLEFLAVGGAPISIKLLEHAKQLGLPVFQGYGLTECGSVVCLNTPEANRTGSVGKPLPHVKIVIDHQDEIIVQGFDFIGYSGKQTNYAQDEWATGDLGYFDKQGFLFITARKSSLYSTAYGRNIAPEWVESELDTEIAIAESAVFGEGQEHNVSVIVPSTPQIDNDQLARAVEDVNQRLPDYAQLGGWIRAESNFNTSNGQRSASSALCRDTIYKVYQNDIEQLFQASHQPLNRGADTTSNNPNKTPHL
jgi:long-subunit acyl-CoA synthetase (AMP-forming)